MPVKGRKYHAFKFAGMSIEYTVSNHGAELQSIRFEGREFLWQGDPAYWGRRAPILFPIVGKVAGDLLRVDGQSYPMKQHGFARDADFAPVPEVVAAPVPEPVEGPADDNRFVMAGDGSRGNYPFKYGLSVRYHVEGKRLYCAWAVENRDGRDLHFQIGAHPAFNLPDYDPSDPVHGYIECHDADGRLVDPVLRHYLVDGLRVPFDEPVRMLRQAQHPDDRSLTPSSGQLALTNDTFAADAFLIEGSQVASATLIDKSGRPVLTVGCPQAQAFGLWAPSKPGCPFVCLEPWCGITDPAGFSGDISGRELIHRLAPGERYEFTYWIEVAG